MRFAALDGWRGVFAIVVVLGHFPALLAFKDGSAVVSGSVMVDMFFILSGFVITAGYESRFSEGYDIRRFLMERLGRIYPIHFVMLMAFVLMEGLLVFVAYSLDINQRQPFTADRSIFAIFTNLLLIQSFNIHDTITWNFPAWCLSTEWAAYVLFALCMLWRPGKTLPFAIVGALISPVALFFLTPHPMQATYDYGLFRSIYGFSLGVIALYAYRWVESRGVDGSLSKVAYTALECAAVAVVFAAPLLIGPTRWQLLLPLFFTGVIVLLAFQKSFVSDLLKSRLMVYLGSISLSIYICHIFLMLRLVNVVEIIERMTDWELIQVLHFDGHTAKFLSLPPVVLYPLTAVFVLFILAFSHYAHRLVEIPGDRWFRQRAKRYFSSQEGIKAGIPASNGLTKQRV